MDTQKTPTFQIKTAWEDETESKPKSALKKLLKLLF